MHFDGSVQGTTHERGGGSPRDAGDGFAVRGGQVRDGEPLLDRAHLQLGAFTAAAAADRQEGAAVVERHGGDRRTTL